MTSSSVSAAKGAVVHPLDTPQMKETLKKFEQTIAKIRAMQPVTLYRELDYDKGYSYFDSRETAMARAGVYDDFLPSIRGLEEVSAVIDGDKYYAVDFSDNEWPTLTRIDPFKYNQKEKISGLNLAVKKLEESERAHKASEIFKDRPFHAQENLNIAREMLGRITKVADQKKA